MAGFCNNTNKKKDHDELCQYSQIHFKSQKYSELATFWLHISVHSITLISEYCSLWWKSISVTHLNSVHLPDCDGIFCPKLSSGDNHRFFSGGDII